MLIAYQIARFYLNLVYKFPLFYLIFVFVINFVSLSVCWPCTMCYGVREVKSLKKYLFDFRSPVRRACRFHSCVLDLSLIP
jgi:hypothetical protein